MRKTSILLVSLAVLVSESAQANMVCLADRKSDCTEVGGSSASIFYEHNRGVPVSDLEAATRFCSTAIMNGRPATKVANVMRIATASAGSAGAAMIAVTCSE
jgi:hypothetical protein